MQIIVCILIYTYSTVNPPVMWLYPRLLVFNFVMKWHESLRHWNVDNTTHQESTVGQWFWAWLAGYCYVNVFWVNYSTHFALIISRKSLLTFIDQTAVVVSISTRCIRFQSRCLAAPCTRCRAAAVLRRPFAGARRRPQRPGQRLRRLERTTGEEWNCEFLQYDFQYSMWIFQE